MFKITAGKGFHITFENGWTASVQFGTGNYCDNRNASIIGYAYEDDTSCPNAEVWAWKDSKPVGMGNEVNYPEYPLEYQTPDDVAKFIAKIARRK